MTIPKVTVSAKQLAKASGPIRRAHGVIPTFDVQRGNRTVTISDPRPDVTAKGNTSLKTIHLKEDGQPASYDGNYLFGIVGFSFIVE